MPLFPLSPCIAPDDVDEAFQDWHESRLARGDDAPADAILFPNDPQPFLQDVG